MDPLDLEIVNKFTLQKHHLTDSSKIDEIPKIVSDIAGLHASGSTTPYLSLFARMNNFKKQMLDEELYEKRSMAKIRCVRKTIFIHPKDMLPIVHNATRRILEKASKAFMLRQGISDQEYSTVANEVLNLLSQEELTAKDLKQKLNTVLDISPLLYYMCDQGLLVRAKPARGWLDKNHHYAPFAVYFPDVDLHQMDEDEASFALVRHYLLAFGPVTESDIFWWTDLGKTRVRKALGELGDEVNTVSVKGLDGAFLLLGSDIAKLKNMNINDAPTVNLLPSLDPYIMGYKDRERYLNQENLAMTFDQMGNATSVILLNGDVVGVWDYENKGQAEIKVFLFKELSKKVFAIIEEKVLGLGEFITEGSVDLKICDAMTPLPDRTVGSFMSPLKDC